MTLAAVPSTDPVDLLINAQNFDKFMNDTAESFLDRLNNTRMTLAGAYSSIATDVVAVETSKATALTDIEDDVSEVDANRLSALALIDADVDAVDAAKVQAVAIDIPAAIAAVALINNRGAWVTATAYAVKDIVLTGGTWYICIVAHTSSASFATDTASKWRVYQGVTTGDLSPATGAALVGAFGSRTVAAKLADCIHVEDYGVQGGDVAVNNATTLAAAFAAGVALGRPVALLAGPYRIGSAVTVPSGLTLICAGGPAETAPLLKQTSTTANHLNITGSGLNVIGRLSFGHTGTPTAGICLNITGVNAKNNNFGIIDSAGCYELLKMSEGADTANVEIARTRNALGQLNVWGDSVYTGTPLYNKNLTINYVDFENDDGVNPGINWSAMLQYCRDFKIGVLGGRINGGTDCFKCYVNDVPGVAANLRWSERLHFGPVVCTNQKSDVIRIKEGDFVTLDRPNISDAAIIDGGAVFVRGLYTDPTFGGNLRANGVKVTRIGQHGIYLRHLGTGRTVLDGCESSDNSRQTPSQSSNLLVDDGVSNWEVRGGIYSYPSNATKASTVLTLTGNPTNIYQLTLNGQVIEFDSVAAGPAAIQVADTARLTAINITDFINNSQLPEVRRLTATLASGSDAITIQLRERGTAGNAYTVSKMGTLMTWTGGLTSTTLLGGTGTNAVSRNVYVNGANCHNYRIMGADLQGGASANITNLGDGQVIDCLGVGNPFDTSIPFNLTGTVANGSYSFGFLYGAIYEFLGVTTSMTAGTCSLQVFIDGVAQGGSSMALSASQRVIKAVAVNGGAGYAVGNTLTVSGGTSTSAATIRVGSVDGSGRITSWSISDSGRYTVQPSNNVATTGGAGTGATFNLGWSTGFTQVLGTLALPTPYRFDCRNSGASIAFTISLVSSAANLNGSLLFRKVTQV